jgi:hypothetical protein
MATNKPRHGYERKRSQVKTKTMGQKHWTKRSRATGEFVDQKKAGKFKSVRREKPGRLAWSRDVLGDLVDGFVLTVLIAVAVGAIYYGFRVVKELRRSATR